jgi:outer membrane protein assembly factor BamE (lipoprotein component of BamABCDE complex)
VSVDNGGCASSLRNPTIESTLMKRALLILFASLTLSIAACTAGSYSRGIFEGRVAGQTEEQVIEAVGKPDVADTSNAIVHKFTYKARTFDTNANGQKDQEAVIIFEKDKSGKFVATTVAFS